MAGVGFSVNQGKQSLWPWERPPSLRRWLRHGVASVLCAIVFVMASAASASDVSTDPSLERQFVARINEFRTDNGLSRLTLDIDLRDASRDWARDMAFAGEISHAEDLGVGVDAGWAKLGENVGVGSDVDELHQAFLDSPSHRANLADPSFNRIGIGVVVEGDAIFTTHRFMERNSPNQTQLFRRASDN